MHTLDGPSTATQQHMYPSTFPIPVPKGLYHLKLSGPEKTISSSINICLILNIFRSIQNPLVDTYGIALHLQAYSDNDNQSYLGTRPPQVGYLHKGTH